MPFGLTASDMITIISFAAIQGAGLAIFMSRFNAKFAVYFEKVNDHGKVLFAGNGALNVMTIEASDRMKKTCSEKHTVEEDHLKEGIDRVESSLREYIVRVDTRSLETKECVAVLQHQVEGGC